MADFYKQVPNALTLARLVLAAGFFASLNAFRYPDQHVIWANIAIVLFIIAAITDILDGYLARRWQVETRFGRLMDPFCDKVLIIGAFIYLAGPRFVVPEWIEEGSFFTMATGVYPWMVVVILARELLVTGVRGVVESEGYNFPSQTSGKLKMILQSVTIPIVLALTINFHTHEMKWAMWVCHLLVYATVIVTVWSGLPYIISAHRFMQGRIRQAALQDPKTGESVTPTRKDIEA